MNDAGDGGCAPVPALARSGSQSRRLRVTLVVPCYSIARAEDLLRLLDSIDGQSSFPDELLVVVQQSRELLNVVEERLARSRPASSRAVFLPVARVSLARNAGVRNSTGDVVAFVDDDSILTETWCAKTRAFYAGCPDAIGVAGVILPRWDCPCMSWFPRELYWMLSCTYWTQSEPAVVRNGYGANMSFRRDAFRDGRVFNEGLGISGWGGTGWRGVGGEEPEFAVRVTRETGRPIYFVPDIIAWHRVSRYRLTTSTLARRAYWEGRFKAAMRRSGRSEERILSTERRLLRSIAWAGVQRLRLLPADPLKAVRQQSAVWLALACVGAGYAEGTLRGDRVAKDA